MITETWITNQKELEKWIEHSNQIINKNYKVISDTLKSESKTEPNPGRGTAIIITKYLYRHITRIDRILGKLTGLNLNIKDKNIYLAAAYIPSISTNFTRKDINKFNIDLHQKLDTLKPNTTILIGGDFNATMNPIIDRKRSTGLIVNKTRPESIILKSLTNNNYQHKLIDIWRYHHPTKKEYTHSVGTGLDNLSESRIDLFLTSPDIQTKPTIVKILKTKINHNLHHYPIELKIQNFVETTKVNNQLIHKPRLDLKNTSENQIDKFKT
jgi:exonuclease III